ncbi:hypothetical protein [Maridesulfovibrio ferrireducens]|uniref:hypothetical protein n=1 Tax=Maridesulfovibrio ferrireducens TaxID=246191 RepID=UPI001A30F0B4|nr:hypothetical protein [Maridesulfovibrio ferrireducens]MBI9110324.1 hypothetical protein [Maridesulfovibrio ferrireducens]
MGSENLHENDDIGEQDDFEKGFAEAESASESLNEDPAEDEAEDLDDGVNGDPQSEEMDEDDASASDQSLSEEDESGTVLDSTDTGSEIPKGDYLVEGRDILDRYFNDQTGNIDGRAPQAPASQVSELVDPDEDIAEDVKDILRVNPDFKAILLEDSDQGKRIRANLMEFGAEAAVPMLESIHQSRDVSARLDAVTRSHEQDERKVHFERVGKAHPDYMELVADPSKKEELGQFNNKVTNWAETLPYKEAKVVFNVMEKGSASEVSELLTKYKKATSGKVDTVDRKKAAAVIAVPGKRKGVPPAKPDSDDFDAGFDEAARE